MSNICKYHLFWLLPWQKLEYIYCNYSSKGHFTHLSKIYLRSGNKYGCKLCRHYLFLSSREASGHMKETAQMKKPQCVVESLKVTPISWGINYHKHTRPHTKPHLVHATVCLTSFSEWWKTLLDIFGLWKPRVEPPEIIEVVCRLCAGN